MCVYRGGGRYALHKYSAISLRAVRWHQPPLRALYVGFEGWRVSLMHVTVRVKPLSHFVNLLNVTYPTRRHLYCQMISCESDQMPGKRRLISKLEQMFSWTARHVSKIVRMYEQLNSYIQTINFLYANISLLMWARINSHIRTIKFVCGYC